MNRVTADCWASSPASVLDPQPPGGRLVALRHTSATDAVISTRAVASAQTFGIIAITPNVADLPSRNPLS